MTAIVPSSTNIHQQKRGGILGVGGSGVVGNLKEDGDESRLSHIRSEVVVEFSDVRARAQARGPVRAGPI